MPRCGDAVYWWDVVDLADLRLKRSNWRGELVSAGVAVIGCAVAATVLGAAWFLIMQLAHLGAAALAHVGSWPLTRVVLEPVRDYVHTPPPGCPPAAAPSTRCGCGPSSCSSCARRPARSAPVSAGCCSAL